MDVDSVLVHDTRLDEGPEYLAALLRGQAFETTHEGGARALDRRVVGLGGILRSHTGVDRGETRLEAVTACTKVGEAIANPLHNEPLLVEVEHIDAIDMLDKVNSPEAVKRNNVTVSGRGTQPMLFAHGFGCDQNMWRLVAPAFESDYRVVLFDHVGAGRSDLSAYSPSKYGTLQGYADDVLEICRQLELYDVVFVGHSVSAMVGILAAIAEPARFSRLILIGPSPCYINEGEYIGGFTRGDIDKLLDFLDDNYLGWSSAMAPVIMGNPERPELAEELTNSFCRTDPAIARHFARVTFLSDNRADLSKSVTPCLILQCAEDVIAPDAVGAYVHAHLRRSRLVRMRATGHCPNLSAPEETIAAMRSFLADRP